MTDLVTLEDKETIFLGDFNVDLIKHETNLKYLHEVYQFEQLISEPTRVVKNISTLIDHIYTTRSEMNRESGVIPLGLSDHHMVYMIRKYKHPKTNHKHTEINYRSYKSFNAEAFQQDLQQVPWSILDNIEDPNDNWTTWKSFYIAILDKHAPQRIRRIRTDSAPWINDAIVTAMQERDDKHEQARRFNTKDLWLGYKKARNELVTRIREAKEQYYSDLVKENMHNSKSLWKTLKLLLPGKHKNGAQSFVVNGVFETDPKVVATAFNNVFVKIGENIVDAFEGSSEGLMFNTRVSMDTLYNNPSIEPSFVLKELKKMSEHKAKYNFLHC